MKIVDLQPQFKRYFLHERGNNLKSYKAVMSSINMCNNIFPQIKEIEDFTENSIREFLHWGRETRGWTAKTFKNHWQNFKSFFDWLILIKQVKRNPTVNIKIPKGEKRIRVALNKSELQKIISTTSMMNWLSEKVLLRNEAIITSFIFTGIRHQELLNLNWENIDFESHNIFVEQGKGKKDRIVPLNNFLEAKLWKYYHFTKKHRGFLPTYVFTGKNSDKKLQQRDIQTICKKISQQSKIKFTPHILRHSFASLCVENNINPFQIQSLLGHSSIITTQTYITVHPKPLQQAVQSLTVSTLNSMAV